MVSRWYFSVLLIAVPSLLVAEQPDRFESEVVPILQQHCVRCHSDANDKGGLSLASKEKLAESGFVIPGDPAGSYLLEAISSIGDDPPLMPKGAEPLSAEQVESIRGWIAAGATWPDDLVIREPSQADAGWWALQPLDEDFDSRQTVDDFVRAELAEHGLELNPPADRRTLIRRATFDLIGLPPTPAEVDDFVNDPDPQAYQRLVDRLLESPHYGERWGRHWLDVVRFGESIGYERNVIVNTLWPFRDYVIRSLNGDKPFDQFIREHIAGDVIAPDDPAVAVGSAFLVAGPYDDVGNQDPVQAAQIRANTLDEIIGATSQAFLGLTIGCARCHDHKFDPITQEDYYGWYATFSGIRHGAVTLATPEQRSAHAAKIDPLNKQKSELQAALNELEADILARGRERLSEYQSGWKRPKVDRRGTEETFPPVETRFVRLVCESQDSNPAARAGFRIDEFEVWSAATTTGGENGVASRNVALAANGARASGASRQIEDFPGAYGPQLSIDGETGARFIAAGDRLTIELAEPTVIDRVVFSSARGESTPEQPKFVFVADYRIEVSDDGVTWREVANGRDRKPVDERHRDHRMQTMETTDAEGEEKRRLSQAIARVSEQMNEVPALPNVWIGTRNAEDAAGPFHVFLGGSPQKPGEQVMPGSLAVLSQIFEEQGEASTALDSGGSSGGLCYELPAGTPEGERRRALADFITHPSNQLTPRVLANRLWHYHFGTGIVDTPSDFGYMGGRPSHPDLLDFIAVQLKRHNWRIKPVHRLIMNSATYRQSADYREDAAGVDAEARLLWRFPPRRLTAEEIRDTILQVTGSLTGPRLKRSDHAPPRDAEQASVPDGGPGFRLYHFMQDNVCTYVPLDVHGPETFRRAVYHQNARASVVDLLTDFDQPDCTFATPVRATTTTPLQALTMLNHSFTDEMSRSFAQRLQADAGEDVPAQIQRAYQLCYHREPTSEQLQMCKKLIEEDGLAALCRVLLNTSELIYVR